ncbi:hypothetical protein [Streptosporangium sp. NPDC023615]|uniref:hypothetical protein n=1 Tax=Streptosporangium sp. NPDC023615 TaxID=3154794 RepID=UPI003438EE22
MTAEKRRQHDQEFHSRKGRIARETRRLIAQVAREAGISEDALRESVLDELDDRRLATGQRAGQETGPEIEQGTGQETGPGSGTAPRSHHGPAEHPGHPSRERPPAPRPMGGCVI